MIILQAFLIFIGAAIFGAVIGSFANVVAIRTHEESSLSGRSHCVHCKTKLKARHLVPVLSWLIQRGRCASCHKHIHIQYPLVELGGAFLAIIAMSRYIPEGGNWLWILFEFAFGIMLLIFLVMDARWMELPLEMMVGAGVIFSLWSMLLKVSVGQSPGVVAWSHIIGFGAATAFFLFQWLVSRGRWIGAGDVWLAAMLGAVLGWPAVGLAIYFAYIFGGGVVLLLMITGKLEAGSRVPFAPALVVGALMSIWFGSWIFNWLGYAVS